MSQKWTMLTLFFSCSLWNVMLSFMPAAWQREKTCVRVCRSDRYLFTSSGQRWQMMITCLTSGASDISWGNLLQCLQADWLSSCRFRWLTLTCTSCCWLREPSLSLRSRTVGRLRSWTVQSTWNRHEAMGQNPGLMQGTRLIHVPMAKYLLFLLVWSFEAKTGKSLLTWKRPNIYIKKINKQNSKSPTIFALCTPKTFPNISSIFPF